MDTNEFDASFAGRAAALLITVVICAAAYVQFPSYRSASTETDDPETETRPDEIQGDITGDQPTVTDVTAVPVDTEVDDDAVTATSKESASQKSVSDNSRAEDKPVFRTESIRGQVVWLADALKDQFGISTVPDATQNSLAILTTDGQVLPIVENLRGRAFRTDDRLRGKDMEILARRYDQQPLIQILRVYEIKEGQRYEVDYWCDICAIVMYESGPCACCQDHNRLRKRLVD